MIKACLKTRYCFFKIDKTFKILRVAQNDNTKIKAVCPPQTDGTSLQIFQEKNCKITMLQSSTMPQAFQKSTQVVNVGE